MYKVLHLTANPSIHPSSITPQQTRPGSPLTGCNSRHKVRLDSLWFHRIVRSCSPQETRNSKVRALFFLTVKVDILISFFVGGGARGGIKQTNKQKLISPKSPKMHAIHLTKRKRALALRGKNLFHFSPATHKLLWGRTGAADSKEVCCIELYWTKALNWLLFCHPTTFDSCYNFGKKIWRGIAVLPLFTVIVAVELMNLLLSKLR